MSFFPRRQPVWQLLAAYSLQDLLHHPWRGLAAVVSVMLGVALAFSVHLINASALDEFARAVRASGAQADLELHNPAPGASLDEAVLGLLRQQPEVALALPMLELSTYAQPANTNDRRLLLRVLGVDALQISSLAPELQPQSATPGARASLLAPGQLFLNAAASLALGSGDVQLQQGLGLRQAHVAGSVRASGAALAVMDIAAAQDFFERDGMLTRIDVRLHPGVNAAEAARRLQALPGWPAGLQLQVPPDPATRVGKLSRAYRVNLSVLALMALFTGGFLVFSVLAQSVARRSQQLALLGVLGLSGRQRLHLVLLEAACLGLPGSLLGLGLGTALAAAALQLLGGDLGGGYFAGAAPTLQWSSPAALLMATLGLATALVGAWWPARLAQALPPAQALKGLGLGLAGTQPRAAWRAAALLLGGALLALAPPLWELPLGAYLGVALLLVGGIADLPWLVGWVLDRMAVLVEHRLVGLLALERARRVRHSAAVAVSGVVASLSLAVALTVMVDSFRQSVTRWLDSVLPASLYVRAGASGSANDTAYFEPAFVQAAAGLAGVQRLAAQRSLALNLDPAKPAVTLLVRTLQEDGTNDPSLPLLGAALRPPPGHMAIYVSEAVADLYGARPGADFAPLQKAFAASTRDPAPVFFVAGIWRDYARQFGSIAMDSADYARLSPDTRSNDLALWLTPGASMEAVQQQLRALADQLAGTPTGQAGQLLEFGSAHEIRARTLTIFDRSFAVTYWLQAVAVGIGLFGIAASFSAQVLARRKEFGLLVHLGFTRRQILRVVAAEGAAWTSLGAVAGLALGLAVALVLVHVVNPQSFHWTMELSLPVSRLLGLAAAVVLAGTGTAWLAGRAAASRDAVLAVKEDW